jgi:predicted ATPase
MAIPIERFRVTGLHGRFNVDIPIRDNCVVLVGVNGLGKTTIINLLNHFLTRQWAKLLEVKFDVVTLEVGGRTVRLERPRLEHTLRQGAVKRWLSLLPPSQRRRVEKDPNLLLSLATRSLLSEEERESGLHHLGPHSYRYLWDEESLQSVLLEMDSLKRADAQLVELVPEAVLYLPTYRRIERDLEHIFPGLEEEIARYRRGRPVGERANVEFVEFGMRDVELRLQEVCARLKDLARLELNKLTATYLGEVIRGEASTFDRGSIATLESSSIERMVRRVEERGLLTSTDRATLRDVIQRLQTSDVVDPQSTAPYVGHFFIRLMAVHETLVAAESSLVRFVDACNRYLEGKRLVFNDKDYVISIVQDRSEAPLEMRQLSSGEKQIISLFTQVLVGEEKAGLIVLIDEPELSLSVPWQKQLLPDIRDAARCKFLAAVTHSPFIFDNVLEPYATDLRQCIAEV